jgi:tryptophanyl-tRNA synthetase
MKRVLTALQPSGILHLGNYFGAIEPMTRLQEDNDLFMFVVDYHAITVPQDPKKLREQILFATAVYLAAGIKPNKTFLFQQSQVPQHTELAWVLTCLTGVGQLERMTQYKDKSDKQDTVYAGLLNYPTLMAADILLYDTDVVPVGDDQKQHLELARDLAQRFNSRYGETFTVPKPRIREFGARIMGLDNAENKMSKSAESEKNYISLMDDDDTVMNKVKSAVTDSDTSIKYDPENKPEISNLLTIYSLVTKRPAQDIAKDYAGKGYGTFKEELAENVILWLKPLRAKIKTYMENEDELIKVLEKGSEKAQKIAENKMEQVRKHIGVSL